MLCFKLYFDIEKIKCFALSSQELTENTDNHMDLRKYWCPVWAIVLHLPLPSGCWCSWKNITILQDNSSSKPHSLSLDFYDLVILEDLHFIGIARTLFHTLFWFSISWWSFLW